MKKLLLLAVVWLAGVTGAWAQPPCDNMLPIACGTPTVVSLTQFGGFFDTQPCGPLAFGNEQLYSFTPAVTGNYSINVTAVSGDPIIYMWKAASDGCNSSNWNCLATVSAVGTYGTMAMTAGTAYYLRLDRGQATAAPAVHTFDIACLGTPPCSNILPLTCATPTSVSLTGLGNPDFELDLGCGFDTPGNEQIYSFTAPISGVYQVSITATSGDYIDYFWKAASFGCDEANWNCLNDQNATGPVGAPITLTAGTQYYFLLDAENDAVTATATFEITCGQPFGPDPCTTVQNIAACATPVNLNLTGPGFGWDITVCGGTTPGGEQIYTFTPATSGLYQLEVTAATGDPISYFYKPVTMGCNNGNWICIGEADVPAISNGITLTAGTQYYFLADGTSLAGGSHTFQINCAVAGPCDNILPIAACATPVNVSLTGLGLFANNTGCLFTTPGNEQIYSFTPAVSGIHTINVTSATGEYIDYFWKPASAGCDDQNWNCIDDANAVGVYGTMNWTAGTTYYLLLDVESANPAAQTFEITCATPPPPDPCTSIITIANCGVPQTATLAGAGAAWDITTCGFNTPGAEQLYSFTPTITGNYNLQVTAATGGYVDYFWKNASGGCGQTGWTCIDDWNGPATSGNLAMTAGQTYYFLLDGEGTGSRTHTFQVVCPALPPVDPCTAILNIAACGTDVTATLPGNAGLWDITACAAATTPGREQIYTFTPTTTGNYQLSTSAVSNGARYFWKPVSAGCNNLNWNCIGTSTFAGNVGTAVALTAGVQYYILVDASTTNLTTHTFTIQCPPTDPCTNIVPLTCGTNTTVNLAAGSDIFVNQFCGFGVAGRERIYSYTAPATGTYFINVSAATGGYIDYGFKAASLGCSDAGFTCIDDINAVGNYGPFTLTGGTQYYFLLDGEGTGAKSQTFQLRRDSSAFAYTGSPFCQSTAANPTPTVTGNTGGTFSSTAGLSINATTGTINLAASTGGTYVVTHTPAGGCGLTTTRTVVVTPAENATFNYSANSFCQNATDPTPTITGVAGGTFTSTPAGLSINATTGVIDVSASTVGSYTVTYTTTGVCPGTGTQTIGIVAPQSAAFSYSASSYCANATNPTPTITGNTGGTFSATPAGLSINATTGVINLAASTPGTYTVTYTNTGACGTSSTQSVTVTAVQSAAFTYTGSPYCSAGTDPTPTITGVSGGTFSSTAGLVINATTGVIDLSASTAGTYTVTYTTPGVCFGTSTQSVTINTSQSAAFSYSASNYCKNAANPAPTITGNTGGTFSATPAGLSINATTGVINLAASTAGTYTVTYTNTGACGTSSTQSVTVTAVQSAAYTYTGSPYCSAGTDPTPTITGVTGGTFTSTAGLSLNATTGVIDLSASTAGTYTVTYTTPGVCFGTSTQSVTINTSLSAAFTYGAGTFCQSAGNATPTITGNTGGVFSSTPAGLSLNAATGVITTATSTAGTYTVTYTVSGTCGDVQTQSVTISTAGNASFSYASGTLCQNAANATPTITGNPGGTFNATPAGLTINATTGEINASTSTVGTYTVTYAVSGTCPATANQTVVIAPADDASFTYASTSFCQDAANPSPTITGLSGGVFTAAPAGLSINGTTGEVTLATSTPGTYTVTYTTAGTCPATATATVTVTALDNATFSYASNAFCQDAANPTPTITGVPGGTFTSSAGLVINPTTGEIDLAASTAGNYSVMYTTNGTCPGNNSFTVFINAVDDASFSYASPSFCQAGTNPTPAITGATGGVFTSSPAGLAINAATGEIDLAASTLGSYTVTYTTTGTCPASMDVTVGITSVDDASFNYASGTFCQSEPNPAALVTGVPGGSFSSTAGLVIDATTGEIDLAASTIGTYTITYATTGVCANSSTQDVEIVAEDAATVTYDAATYCDTLSNPTPAITGSTGGTFSSTAGLVINAATGEIDLAASTAGLYTITYTTPGICPVSVSTDVTIQDCPVGRMDATLASALRLYPNPVTGREVFIDVNVTGTLALNFTDLQGRSIFTRTVEATAGNALRVELPELAVGTYLVRINGQDASSTFHLVVVR